MFRQRSPAMRRVSAARTAHDPAAGEGHGAVRVVGGDGVVGDHGDALAEVVHPVHLQVFSTPT